MFVLPSLNYHIKKLNFLSIVCIFKTIGNYTFKMVWLLRTVTNCMCLSCQGHSICPHKYVHQIHLCSASNHSVIPWRNTWSTARIFDPQVTPTAPPCRTGPLNQHVALTATQSLSLTTERRVYKIYRLICPGPNTQLHFMLNLLDNHPFVKNVIQCMALCFTFIYRWQDFRLINDALSTI